VHPLLAATLGRQRLITHVDDHQLDRIAELLFDLRQAIGQAALDAAHDLNTGPLALFLNSLIERGLRGVRFIASDDHAGLKAARKALFPGVPWQRCQFHLQHNAQGYVSRLDQRTPVARQIRGIFNAPDAIEAQRLLNAALKDWQVSHPQLAAWAQKNLPEGFAVFDLPEGHRVRMRTANGLERLNKELKRRTRVATLIPSTNSCLRPVSALLAEQDGQWIAAKIYLTMKP
jgi:transposase-like protein